MTYGRAVYCRDCDNVHGATRKEDPWKWRCVCVPIEPGYGFVDPDHSPNPPYERCSKVNTTGNCSMYEAVRSIAIKGENDAAQSVSG